MLFDHLRTHSQVDNTTPAGTIAKCTNEIDCAIGGSIESRKIAKRTGSTGVRSLFSIRKAITVLTTVNAQ
jgi:hypothetical protein